MRCRYRKHHKYPLVDIEACTLAIQQLKKKRYLKLHENTNLKAKGSSKLSQYRRLMCYMYLSLKQ